MVPLSFFLNAFSGGVCLSVVVCGGPWRALGLAWLWVGGGLRAIDGLFLGYGSLVFFVDGV